MVLWFQLYSCRWSRIHNCQENEMIYFGVNRSNSKYTFYDKPLKIFSVYVLFMFSLKTNDVRRCSCDLVLFNHFKIYINKKIHLSKQNHKHIHLIYYFCSIQNASKKLKNELKFLNSWLPLWSTVKILYIKKIHVPKALYLLVKIALPFKFFSY
jgi:hypothetical protein